MSNPRNEESDDESGLESIFSMLNEMEQKINEIDISKLNVNVEKLKNEGDFDLTEEFQKLENDRDFNRSHPEMLNNLKQVMILMDAVKQFMPPKN